MPPLIVVVRMPRRGTLRRVLDTVCELLTYASPAGEAVLRGQSPWRPPGNGAVSRRSKKFSAGLWRAEPLIIVVWLRLLQRPTSSCFRAR